jgi:hypothetical protein
MVEILVKIMVELLSALGLVTKQITQKRPGEPPLLDRHVTQSPTSQNCKEIVWRK